MFSTGGGQFIKIPRSSIAKAMIYPNTERKTMDEIKKELGCDIIQNAGYFNMKTFKPMNHLVCGGKVLSNSPGKIGLSCESDKVEISYDNQIGYQDHVSGYPWLVASGKAQTVFPKELIPATKRGVVGLNAEYLFLGTFTSSIVLTALPSILIKIGCTYALNLDGGGSVQRNWNGERYWSSRIVHNFICIWLKKDETKPETKKEDDDMKIIQDLIPKGRKNRPGRANPMLYITVHDTDNMANGADALAHASYLKSDEAVKKQVSWHYTVDDRRVVQHIPDNEDAWHAGDGAGPGNRKSIGVEICTNSNGNRTKAADNAAELVANLCKKHNIPVENVVQHNHWNGKTCPRLIRAGNPYSWDTFIAKVRNHLNPPAVTKTDEPASWAKSAWDAAKVQGIMDGTRPTDTVSRQELAVVLDRLGLI